MKYKAITSVLLGLTYLAGTIPAAFAIDITSKEAKQGLVVALNSFIGSYREVISVLSAVGALTSFLVFIILFMRLGSNYTGFIGQIDRYRDMRDIAIAGVLTALLGGISLVTSIFYQTIFGIQ